ncbi:MAG: hypothetical protein O9328_18160 [Rhodobacteraceae bacterium]|nr:hypothetical protein [Paracoccaceae bacterium]
MLLSSRLLPGIVHEIFFRHPQAELHLMDAEASDIFLFLGLKGSDTHLTINNRRGGIWGVEEKLILPPHDDAHRLKVSFKLTERQVEIWNAAAALEFVRCDASIAKGIAFSRLAGVDNPLGSLSFRVMTPEAMGIEIGYQVLNHRIARLEKVGLSLADEGLDPTPEQDEVGESK